MSNVQRLPVVKSLYTYRSNATTFRVRSIGISESVNGPGRRVVVHFQGCDLACPGCFNPHLWSTKARAGVKGYSLVELTAIILTLYDKEDCTGVTLTGGEPFQQGATLLLDLIQQLLRPTTKVLDLLPEEMKRRHFITPSITLFSGYTYAELLLHLRKEDKSVLLMEVDILISGRYEQFNPALAGDKSFASSDNQEVSRGRYSEYEKRDLERAFDLDLIVDHAGETVMMGFPQEVLVSKMAQMAGIRQRARARSGHPDEVTLANLALPNSNKRTL